ncbi:MAG: hypothetical protein H6959_06230 [Chromatiaceae bacterium]|nr:hypothetical protein [Chromatiaceae bacterium]MCP5422496.1 hypothetical protein [Chromatiaceae bacterium]
MTATVRAIGHRWRAGAHGAHHRGIAMIGWLLVWVLLGLPLAATAATQIGDVAECEAFERALLLSDRRNALHSEVRQVLLAFDRQQALRPGAVTTTGENSPHCTRLRELLRSPGTSDTEIATALSDFPVLISLNSTHTPPLQVFANTPGLADWAGRPLVAFARFDQGGNDDRPLRDELLAWLRQATAFTQSLAAFFAGNRSAAATLRPPPDGLAALPRAWLSGIPLHVEQGGFLRLAQKPAYDDLPRKGGERSYALVTGVASGRLSPEAALRLSIPANNVLCLGSESQADAEVRWAGFVSGFWRVLGESRSGGGIRSADPIGRLDRMFAGGTTCFDATLYPLLEERQRRRRVDDVLADLDALIGATMTGPRTQSARVTLARELLAASVLPQLLNATQGSQEGSRAVGSPGVTPYLEQCQPADGTEYDAIGALLAGVTPRTTSPVAPLLAIGRRLYAAGVQAAEPVLPPSAGPGAAAAIDWIAAMSELPQLLVRAAAQFDPALATRLRERFATSDDESRVGDIVDTLLNSDDADYEDLAAGLRDELHAFSLQVQVASQLAFRRIARIVYPIFLSGQLGSLFNREEQRAYERFLRLFPQLADPDHRRRLYRTSPQNAIRVAVLDILQLSYDFRLSDPTASLPPADRNPWLLFAPNTHSLPEVAIPAIDRNANSGAAVVALSAAVHALRDLATADGDADAAHPGSAVGLLGPGVIGLDLLHKEVLQRGSDTRYEVSDTARKIFTGLSNSDLLSSAQVDTEADSPIADLVARLPLARLTWSQAVRPYVEEFLTDGRDPAAARLLVDDFELSVRLTAALLDPDLGDPVDVAEAVESRLATRPDWPAPLHRLAARLALELLEDPRHGGIPDDASQRHAAVAEFDALLPHASRQNLIDAGFLPAAASAIPLRLVLAAHAVGGVQNLTGKNVADVLTDELSSFDYRIAASRGPLRDLTELVLALLASPDAGDYPDSGLSALKSTSLGSGVLRLAEHARQLADQIEPSPTAQAFSELIVLGGVVTTLDTAAGERRKTLATAGLAKIARASAACPNIRGSLAPVEVALTRQAGLSVAHDRYRDVLREIVAQDAPGKALMLRVVVDFLDSFMRFSLSTAAPSYPSGELTGNLTLDTGFSSVDKPWRISSAIGVEATGEPDPTALRLALELAEAAAYTGQKEALDGDLVVLEALIIGADPFSDQATDWRHLKDPLEDPERTFFGIPIGSALPLAARLQGVADMDRRLLRVATEADRQGLTALARRIAGIGAALALERHVASSTSEEPPDAAETAAVKALSEQLDGFAYPPGYLLARQIAAGRMAVPSAYFDWVICAAQAPTDDRDCTFRPGFLATTDVMPPNADTPSPQTTPAADNDSVALTPCEQVARAVFGDRPVAAQTTTSHCLRGPLGVDAAGLGDPSASSLAGDAQRGFPPLGLAARPALIDERVKVSLPDLTAEQRSTLFIDAGRLMLATGDLNRGYRYALLATLSQVAGHDSASLDASTLATIAQLAEQLRDERLRAYFTRLAMPGATVSDTDRTFAQQLINVIVATL